MLVNGIHRKSLWEDDSDPSKVFVIDQRHLPFEYNIFCIDTLEKACTAIEEMVIRGAPLIGITAAYGLYIHSLQLSSEWSLELKRAGERLCKCRPTAVNLSWAVSSMLNIIDTNSSLENNQLCLRNKVRELYENDIESCRSIGEYGFEIINEIYSSKKDSVNILTHCNAGWLACVDYGTATAPMYMAHNKGIPIHIWVDETRPRNQGARLTSWELSHHGINNTVIVDNAGGHLMQKGLVDLVLVGADRVASNGDAANKIGTYLKALAAKEHNIPFYVALPTSTIDWSLKEGLNSIPIENRNPEEITSYESYINGKKTYVPLMDAKAKVSNPSFDVTPAKLISGFITERGVYKRPLEMK